MKELANEFQDLQNHNIIITRFCVADIIIMYGNLQVLTPDSILSNIAET